MTRQKFVERYLTPSTASTIATRRATAQDTRNAQQDRGVDYHVTNSTTKE